MREMETPNGSNLDYSLSLSIGEGQVTGISGFNAGPLPELRQVLRKWIFVNKDYVHRWDGIDAPWWYNERASVSALAAAAWLAKGIALEEYTTRKTRNINRSRSVVSDR